MNDNKSCREFRESSKTMLSLYTKGHRDKAAGAKQLALSLYQAMNLNDQENSLLWS